MATPSRPKIATTLLGYLPAATESLQIIKGRCDPEQKPNKMQARQNLKHWHQLAETHGEGLEATTKCSSIKTLELDVLARTIIELRPDASTIVEVGCGNAVNLFGLQKQFSQAKLVGVDFSDAMIEHSVQSAKSQLCRDSLENVALGVMDVRSFHWPPPARWLYQGSRVNFVSPPDIIFTDRCLINLADRDEQADAVIGLTRALAPGGFFLMLENSQQAHARLNEARKSLGLEPRLPATYNVFIDEQHLLSAVQSSVRLVQVRDFASLHDLFLYALAPSLRGGIVEYDTPLMEKVTALSLYLNREYGDTLSVGQNRIWIWQAN
jgi:SAM-dependent methyltransferase